MKVKIEDVAVNAINGIQAGYEIYKATAAAMDAIEDDIDKDGKSKLAWVLAYIKGTIEEVAENWSYWSELLIKFINSIKFLYNIVKTPL
jgi:hypothetical protein